MGLFTFSAKDKKGFRVTRFHHISGFREFSNSGLGDVLDCTINTELKELSLKAVTSKKHETKIPFNCLLRVYTSSAKKGISTKTYLNIEFKKYIANTSLSNTLKIVLEVVQASYKWQNFVEELEAIISSTQAELKKTEYENRLIEIRNRKPELCVWSTYLGQYNAYNYSVFFTPTKDADEIFSKMQIDNNWWLDLKIEDKVQLIYQGDVFGTFDEHKDMIKDFWERKDIVKAQLKFYENDYKQILIQFFRNHETQYADCESDEIELTNCLNSECQENLEFVCEGALLDIEKVSSTKVTISDCASLLGDLPKEYAKRYIDEGAKGAFFIENSENDNGKYIPLIKIYW